MGKPIYRAMGYETIYDYRLLLSPGPRSDPAQGLRLNGG